MFSYHSNFYKISFSKNFLTWAIENGWRLGSIVLQTVNEVKIHTFDKFKIFDLFLHLIVNLLDLLIEENVWIKVRWKGAII